MDGLMDGGLTDGWLTFNSISVIAGQREVNNERLCVMELLLRLER